MFSMKVLLCLFLFGIQNLCLASDEQNDPFYGLLTTNFVNITPTESFHQYFGLYQQGMNLSNSCAKPRERYKYASKWKEEDAKRSIAATLQFVGLNYTIKAISQYAKNAEINYEDYTVFVDKLITSSCSPNVSVLSLKSIRSNLLAYYQEDLDILPVMKKEGFFSKELTNTLNSKDNKTKEFDLTLKNFRSFCSWDGKVDDYRMLTSYLSNPYIMTSVFNHLEGKTIAYDNQKLNYKRVESKATTKVACQDLICRQRDDVTFSRLYPIMVGSSSLSDDFTVLYCEHFRNLYAKTTNPNLNITNFFKERSYEDAQLENNQFLALITGIPDLLNSVETFQELAKYLKSNFDQKWTAWASQKNKSNIHYLLYEDALDITLVPHREFGAINRQEFNLTFDLTMGEMDKALQGIDKVDMEFKLVFPRSFLAWMRGNWIEFSNQEADFELKNLTAQATEYIQFQLKGKENKLQIPIWNDGLAEIIALELFEQLMIYQGSDINVLNKKIITVPVQMRFGLFALQYQQKRFSKYQVNKLTKL
jgi:hypothetical protein